MIGGSRVRLLRREDAPAPLTERTAVHTARRVALRIFGVWAGAAM